MVSTNMNILRNSLVCRLAALSISCIVAVESKGADPRHLLTHEAISPAGTSLVVGGGYRVNTVSMPAAEDDAGQGPGAHGRVSGCNR